VRLTKKILLIDDESHLHKIVQTSLEKLGGWEVLVANSALDGLVLAQSEKPDAILLDVIMPQMSGVAFLEKLQSLPEISSIPVIFLTSRVDLTEPQRFSALGARGAIAKPFNPLNLVFQINQILGWNQEKPN
jgi:CheY-like chemotaxis protein